MLTFEMSKLKHQKTLSNSSLCKLTIVTSDEDNESIPIYMFLDMGRQEPYQLKRRLLTCGQTARRDIYCCTRQRHNKSSFVFFYFQIHLGLVYCSSIATATHIVCFLGEIRRADA